MKELRIRISPKTPNLYDVYYEGGGELPESLSGLYVSEKDAQYAIDMYLSNRKRKIKKVEDNG